VVESGLSAVSDKARLYGESVDEGQRAHAHDTVDRCQRPEDVDLTIEAERAWEKLVDVCRAQE
jgi:hypothetical protein